MNRALTKILLLTLLGVGLLLLTICGVEWDPQETVHGRVTDVQARSITEVDTFSILDAEGETWIFAVEGPLEFSPSHLREHMLTGEGVSVRFRRAGDALIAVGVADYP